MDEFFLDEIAAGASPQLGLSAGAIKKAELVNASFNPGKPEVSQRLQDCGLELIYSLVAPETCVLVFLPGIAEITSIVSVRGRGSGVAQFRSNFAPISHPPSYRPHTSSVSVEKSKRPCAQGVARRMRQRGTSAKF